MTSNRQGGASDRWGALYEALTGGRVVALLVPLLVITASELSLYFGQLQPALVGHLFLLLFCVLAPLRFTEGTPLFRAFALVPLFRLSNLGMPVFIELTVLWFPLIYGVLFPAIYLIMSDRTQGGITIDWGARWLALLPVVLPLTAVLALLEFVVIDPGALITAWIPLDILVITVVMVLFVGLVEELIFRGILQQVLQDQLGRWTGLIITSAVFGLMHSGYGVPAEMFIAGGIGFIFGLIYDRTRSMLLITVMHGLLNVALFGYYPLFGIPTATELFQLLPL